MLVAPGKGILGAIAEQGAFELRMPRRQAVPRDVEADQFHSYGCCRPVCAVGVVGQHAHPEPRSAGGYQGTDPAQADHPQGLAVDLDALELLPVPHPGSQLLVGAGHMSCQTKQQSEGVFGRTDRVGRRCVGHQHRRPRQAPRLHLGTAALAGAFEPSDVIERFLEVAAYVFVYGTLLTTVGSGTSYVLKTRRLLAGGGAA